MDVQERDFSCRHGKEKSTSLSLRTNLRRAKREIAEYTSDFLWPQEF